jgi:Dolichyl-phosphate-mannose-protein mannosyltransferase
MLFKSILRYCKEHQRWVTGLLFLLILVVGLCMYSDYGIGWDDEMSRTDTGYIYYDYITKGNTKALMEGNEKYHGPFLEVLLVCYEKACKQSATKAIYRDRHLILFLLFFLSLIAFYKTAKKMFARHYAWLACIILVLSPRIFAESFYNTKDLGLLIFFNFSLYSYFQFLEKRNVRWALIHAFFSGCIVSVRIIGIVVPLATILYYPVLHFIQRQPKSKLYLLLVYVVFSFGFITLFWPVLWQNPIDQFAKAFAEMKKYHWFGDVLYLGKKIPASKLPWHYLPVWIGISTPVIFTVLFIVGLISYVKKIFSQSIIASLQDYKINSVVLLFLFPIAAIIALHSVIYDAWRHIFYVYPLFVLIAVLGFQKLLQFNFSKFNLVLKTILSAQCIYIMVWMYTNHPHQNIYFNNAARMYFKNMHKQFELDYWGLSYKQALAYLLKTETGPIRFVAENKPAELNMLAFTKEEQARLVSLERDDTTSRYYVTNYRTLAAVPRHAVALKILYVDSIPFMGIYKLEWGSAKSASK